MGKRKERRLAAKTAANRRVKLDLLAEPSGRDFGESSNKEEVGGGDSANNHAGSPNSPSSSEGIIVLVDVYFIQDMFALPRYSFQTVRWLWYWELNWSSELVQHSHSVSLIEIPDMLCPFFSARRVSTYHQD
ncbi:hypothetical protein OSB04_007890 [Centaurea solstitialis]|uniref:Uncharacterized protein n=1 Tax=Centaurea solstitialis TaxID=347529 RepID=A0AA38WR40_9ASTR|nr:hypothetical protein OSB04_007890 [Centaurea solstitialis]